MKTRRKPQAPGARPDRVVHGFNVDREWRLWQEAGLHHSGVGRLGRTAYFWRSQAINWLRWAQGRAGLGTAEARAIGRKFALSYLAGWRAAKAQGAAAMNSALRTPHSAIEGGSR